MNDRYLFESNRTLYRSEKGETVTVANFVAKIDEEISIRDGRTNRVLYKITGRRHNPDDPEGTPLPAVEVPAGDFPNFAWVAQNWGVATLIYPISSAERELRAAIQSTSAGAKQTIIYTHTGDRKSVV